MPWYKYGLHKDNREFADYVLFFLAKFVDLILSPVRHYRLGSVVKLLSIVFRKPKTGVIATLSTGGKFIFPVYDISWGTVIYGARPYEAEAEWLFRKLTGNTTGRPRAPSTMARSSREKPPPRSTLAGRCRVTTK